MDMESQNRPLTPATDQNLLLSLPPSYRRLLQLSKADRLHVLKAELVKRQSNDRGLAYEPNQAIEAFIRQVGETRNLVYFLSTANGVGKTTVVANLLRNLFFGPSNRYFDFPIFRAWPFPKKARYITTPKNAEDSGAFRSEIETWWPKGQYTARKNGRHYHSEYEVGEWFMDVMTYDQAPEQFESNNIGIQILDEPPPRALWPRIVSRTRKGGIIVIVMTPLTDAGWIFDELIPRHSGFITYANVETACKQHGVRGHLEHSDIENMIAEYPSDEREARVDGKAMYLKGLIFKTFDPSVHVLKNPVKAPYSATMYQVVDPHDDKPFACIWGFPDAQGDIYVVDEWPNEEFHKMHNCQIDVEGYVKLFRDKESGWNVRRRIMDRRYGEASRTTNRKTLREEFEAQGMFYEQSYSAQEEIETGIIKVRSYLKYDPDKPISALNHPKLYINPGCTNLIRSMSRWSRDPKTGNVNDDSYKDFCDTMRYFLMASPKVDAPLPPHQPKKSYGG